MGLGGIDGHAAVVAHMAMGAGCEVEERGLAAVGIAHESHVDRAALLHGNVLDVVILVILWIQGSVLRSVE